MVLGLFSSSLFFPFLPGGPNRHCEIIFFLVCLYFVILNVVFCYPFNQWTYKRYKRIKYFIKYYFIFLFFIIDCVFCQDRLIIVFGKM